MSSQFSGTPFSGVVALDGPAGTGKSTVARRLASALGVRYLDTGAMYRAATVAVLRDGVDLADPVAITHAVEGAKIEISTDPEQVSITLDGVPADTEIRAPETTAAVSAVSAVPAVRALLVAAQRELIDDGGGIVVEGRDIGSVVWPTARPKVYLTASAAARARRRAGEFGGDVDAVATDIARRDNLDSTRAASPLTQAADATVLDTTDLDIDQVVQRLLELSGG
ncbi:(d)CMP kinase [uncultured Jatrophihabitans sp.]|uniref:(d)CMP kinase n=1 Tax=uncultured Jatrophihabitans sp. TaxID=1610747 RepID=UPI0035CC9146